MRQLWCTAMRQLSIFRAEAAAPHLDYRAWAFSTTIRTVKKYLVMIRATTI